MSSTMITSIADLNNKQIIGTIQSKYKLAQSNSKEIKKLKHKIFRK